LAALLVSGVSARATDPSLYAITSNGTLGRLDPVTGVFSVIGSSGGLSSDNIGGLAVGAGGVLYGLGDNAGNGKSELYSLNTSTGAATWIGEGSSLGSGYGLTSTADGTLYAFLAPGGSDYLYTVNPTTGADTQVGALNTQLLYGNLAASPGGLLYINRGYSTEQLYSLNLSTGAATLIGNTGTADSYAIAYGGNTLYLVGLNGTISSLNPSTGAATTVSTYNNAYGYLNGLASTEPPAATPTPEPTTLALGGFGLLALAWRWRPN
jgi:hypothetical protein